MQPDGATPVLRAWRAKAAGDLEAARVCLATSTVPAWIVGFHLQQAAEKAFKGMLVAAGCEPPRTHDLVRLHQMLSERGCRHPLSPANITLLQPFAVEDRYPLLLPTDGDRQELRAAWDAVARLVDTLAKLTPPDP